MYTIVITIMSMLIPPGAGVWDGRQPAEGGDYTNSTQ